ncbi:GPW/gp25 family protein [Herbidospora galbida]|uniref:GPW/gp25 family protein n=1 Tax=Herbidospora galbida TaxID=2575442 RepID=A0A4U3MNF9_9ACTN|nr:GPW/gp25 family protein [Herbidospora galbida]TKK89556.1 GPW/gp25 family protein [Herbidospora galbida]
MDGRGVAFPVRVDETGGIAESAGAERIRQSILVILGTRPGERIMRPDFGCELHDLAFAPNTPATANLARHYVESALARWEPRIEVTGVGVGNDLEAAALMIAVTYRIRSAGDERTLTLPFSLEQPS